MADGIIDDMEIIKKFIVTQKFPSLTDEQIMMFISSSQNNLQATKEKLLSYFLIKKKNPDVFNDWNLEREDVKLQLKTLKYCILPRKTEDGDIILFHGIRDTSYRNYEHTPALKIFLMTFEAALVDQKPKGVIFLLDMEGMGIMHLTKAKIKLQKLFFQYFQDGSPVKLKSVHFLNCVYFMDKCLSLARPFVKREVYETFHFHPSNINMDEFYANYIPKQCLPEEYGGYLPSVEDLHAENTKKLNDMKLYFQTREEQLKTWSNKH